MTAGGGQRPASGGVTRTEGPDAAAGRDVPSAADGYWTAPGPGPAWMSRSQTWTPPMPRTRGGHTAGGSASW